MTENDRLTHEYANGPRRDTRSGEVCHYWTNAGKRALAERLGEYEDTGYSPEELKRMIREKIIP